jgi:hypothetical protein
VTSGPIVEDVAPNGGCAWGDYDNDGFPELFVSVFGGKSRLYHNEGTTNNWVKVNLISTKSNGSAIGAKVRVTAIIQGNSVTQMREIGTGDGFGSSALIAHFGLGDATNIDLARIEWPSGTVQVMTNVPPQQFLTVTEPAALKAPAILPDGSFQFSLIGGVGVRYDLETSSDLGSWTAWTSLTCTNRTMTLTDTNVITGSGRFYRAVKR